MTSPESEDTAQLPPEVLRILFELDQDFARSGAPLSLARHCRWRACPNAASCA